MLLAFWMVQRLTREINTLELQAMRKQTELTQHQKYAGMLGGSSTITALNIAGLSSNLIPRASIFAQFSEQASSMHAMQQVQMMKMSGMMPYNMQNPMMQMQIEMSAFNQFKQEAMKQMKQQEAAVLNEVEKEIQLELNHIEMQLKMKRQQLDNYKQLASNDIKNCLPTFGLG